MQNKLPNIFIPEEVTKILNKNLNGWIEYVPKERMDIAVVALFKIASLIEGPEVNSSFDEPNSAREARAALKELGE
jgi:hypothetical protein